MVLRASYLSTRPPHIPTHTRHGDSVIMPTILQQFTSPPAQTLRTLQPTPSTIQYTVSTRPIPSTIPARLTHYAGYLIRCFVGLATALLLWTRWRLTYEKSTDILQWALSSTHEAWLHKVAESCQWIYLAPSALVAVFLALRRGYTGTTSVGI